MMAQQKYQTKRSVRRADGTMGPPGTGRALWAGGKSTKGPMRRTTKRGAYGKTAKKAFAIRRRPFVEIKKRVQSVVNEQNGATDERIPVAISLANTENYYPIHVDAFNRLSSGVKTNQAAGTSEYGKWISVKIQLQTPANSDLELVAPFRVWLVHGWVKPHFGRTEITTPTVSDATQSDLRDHIDDQVKQYFNEREDRLTWNEMSENIKILGYKEFKNDRNAQLTIMPMEDGTGSIEGGYPDMYETVRWTVNRKIGREIGTPPYVDLGTGSPEQDRQNMYPNTEWLPFCCLYTDVATALAGSTGQLKLGQNSCYWFSDS